MGRNGPNLRLSLEEVKYMFRWKARYMRAAVALAAVAALVISAGADWRWN
jgi:hypothetical protein